MKPRTTTPPPGQGVLFRNLAIGRVAKTSHTWLRQALQLCTAGAMVRHVPPTFTGEDLSLAIIGRIGKPPHPNARGALVMRLVQSELIARTGA